MLFQPSSSPLFRFVVGLFISAALGIAAPSSRGDFFVTAIGSDTIYRVSSSGVATPFASDSIHPSGPGPGLALTAQGDLLVTSGSGAVDQITANGNVSVFSNGPFFSPGGIAINSTGEVFVANTAFSFNSVFKVAPNGGSSSPFAQGGGLNGPQGLAFNAQGDLFVGNAFGSTDTISEITPSGVVSTFASGQGLVQPGALAFDVKGDLFVANLGYINYLSEITANGTVITPFGTSPGFGNFSGIAFDSNGDLFATQPGTGDIWEFFPDGSDRLFTHLPFEPNGIVFIPEQVASAPAPSGLILFGMGIAGLLSYGCCRRLKARLADLAPNALPC